MPPQVSPGLAAGDILCGLGLGFLVGLLRCGLPVRRGAVCFLADFFAVGFGLLLAQSYAVRYAAAGELRWYLPAAVLLGAVSVQVTLGPVAELAFLPAKKLWRTVFLFLRRRHRAHKDKQRKKAMENRKKQLQNQQKVLYNSNV
ncbi:MAG: hypothetical protein IJ347_04810 [Faecalibacterium sp.]|nr:hypothetical protein [Faecalibacterium sp.]